MKKLQWHLVTVEMNVPDREHESIEIGLEAYDQSEAVYEAFNMVIQEEGLRPEDRGYLSVSLLTSSDAR